MKRSLRERGMPAVPAACWRWSVDDPLASLLEGAVKHTALRAKETSCLTVAV